MRVGPRFRPIYAVLERELLRMFRQRTRLVAAMVRPLIWLLVIGGGFAAFIGEGRGVDYKSFFVPRVLGVTMLFGAMLAALTTVYDKESRVRSEEHTSELQSRLHLLFRLLL